MKIKCTLMLQEARYDQSFHLNPYLIGIFHIFQSLMLMLSKDISGLPKDSVCRNNRLPSKNLFLAKSQHQNHLLVTSLSCFLLFIFWKLLTESEVSWLVPFRIKIYLQASGKVLDRANLIWANVKSHCISLVINELESKWEVINSFLLFWKMLFCLSASDSFQLNL